MDNQSKSKELETLCGPLVLDIEKESVTKPKESIVLFLSALSSCLAIVSVAANSVWTSPVIWKIKSNDTNINPLSQPVTTFQVALITGLLPLGGIIGTIFLPKFCDIIGRKKTLIMVSIVMLTADIALAFSKTVYIYYIGRFLAGLAEGGAIASASIFLSELSEDHNRGKIGCFIGLSYPIGDLYVYLIGPRFSVKNFTLLCTIPTIINLLCLLTFIPESPIHLASKGDTEGTMRALRRLRNKNLPQIEKEYGSILKTLEETANRYEAKWSNIFGVKCWRKCFIIAIGLNAFQVLSGISAILAFAEPLFDAAGASLSGDLTAVLIGVVELISFLFTTTIIERVGRRPLLIISTIGICIHHFLLGLFFYLKSIDSPITDKIMWLPVVSILGFIVFYALGIGIIPVPLMTELFPSNMKSKAASAGTFTAISLIFITSTAFPIMIDFLGPAWCLWLFGLFEFLGFLFVYFLVPEIKGKSLLEIKELFSK